MGQKKKFFSGWPPVLRVLFWPLGGFWAGGHLSAPTVRGLVVAGLFSHSTGHCLAGDFSVAGYVLNHGEGGEVKGRNWLILVSKCPYLST